MKKVFFIIFAALTVLSCRTDLKPVSSLTANGYWVNPEAVSANHTALYAQFRNYVSTLWLMGVGRSDVFYQGQTTETPNSPDFTNNNISVTLAPFNNWAGLYTMVFDLNDFITNAPTVPGVDPTQLNHMMGEAYGLRAYVYYTLLKNWGAVPINTQVFNSLPTLAERTKPRSPMADVATQIESDLQASLNAFGSDNSLWQGKNVYWSKAATLTLKGDFYIWHANVMGGGQQDFSTAATALQQVTGFSLVPNYKDLWSLTNKNNKEFIFAVDYQLNQASNPFNGILGARSVDAKSMFDKNGNSLANYTSTGDNRYGLNSNIIQMFYNDPQDTRANATYMLMYGNNNGGAGYPNAFNANAYKGAIWLKFQGNLVSDNLLSYSNYPVYRYAEVLLLLAEAKNGLQQDPSAEINAVRMRAYGANYPSHKYVNSDPHTNTEAILNEELREFLGEGKRWWSLMRNGSQYVIEWVPSFSQAPISGNLKKLYLPIPQGMIDFDPNMTQTDGY